MKGVGRIYQQTFVDTYSSWGGAKLYTHKTPITAADLLTDHLLPPVRYRQWVFTYPIALRFRMARDPKLMTAVLQRSIAAMFALQRRQGRTLGVTGPMPAALTAIQKFGSAINLHPHAHVLTPEGVFAPNPDDTRRCCMTRREGSSPPRGSAPYPTQ